MASAFALLTSDAHLLPCQVDLVKDRLRLETGAAPPRAVGLGYIEADSILLRKKPGDVGTIDPSRLAADVVSEVLFFYAGPPSDGAFADEDIMPLRFRRWMFMHTGLLADPGPVRAKLLEALPAYLAFQVKGTSASEACFLSFIRQMRERGLTEGFDVNPSLIGRMLGEMARKTERFEQERGRVGDLGFFVTNGRAFAATRLGQGSLHYALLEGISRCERCGITEKTPDSNPLLRAHRRVRGVVVASEPSNTSGFIEVPQASCLTVGQGLEVQVGGIE